MAYKKFVRKVAKKAGRAIKRRYFKGKGYSNPKISQMYSDVMALKSMVNAEKKRIQIASSTDNVVGQVNGNTSGHFLLDITPNIAQGVGYNQKSGNSFKLHSSHIDFQMLSQGSNISGCKLKIQVIRVFGQPFSTVSDVMGKFITVNPFIYNGASIATVYDSNSPRDPDYYRNYKVLKTQTCWLKNDDITGESVMKQLQIGLKYKNFHIRTNDNDPTLSSGQILLLITADRGNTSGVASTLTGISQTSAYTGAQFRMIQTHYFYDN